MSTKQADDGFLKALRDALHSSKFWGNRAPLCPHCGAEYDISRNDHWDLYNDDDRHTATCPKCDRDFHIRTHASYSFSTDEQDDLEPPNAALSTLQDQTA